MFFVGVEALLFEDLLGLARLTGENSGGGDLVGVAVGGFGALIGAAIVVGTTAIAVSSMAQGEVPRVRDVYRAVWARFWLLLSAVVRAGLTVVVLTLTVVGIPVAIERSVRWALVPQVCLLGDREEGPLRQSVRVTRGNWWRTFALTSVMNLPAVTLALLVGTAVLLLIPAAPIYVGGADELVRVRLHLPVRRDRDDASLLRPAAEPAGGRAEPAAGPSILKRGG